MSTYIREVRQAAAMDWPVTSHTFRKTAATIWHDAGVLTDRHKADLTGHAKISTLANITVSTRRIAPTRRCRHGRCRAIVEARAKLHHR